MRKTEWRIAYHAHDSKQLKTLEERMALLQNHVSSVSSKARDRIIKARVSMNKTGVTLVGFNDYIDDLMFSSIGRNDQRADLEVLTDVYGDYSLIHNVKINKIGYLIGPEDSLNGY